MLVNLEINRENLKRNLEKIRSINKNIVCVIKDNAYGLGIENVFPILLENNCNYFAVAYIEEAIKIRKILKKFEKEKKLNFSENRKIKIMALNYIEPKNLKYVIENNVELTIFNFSQLYDYLKILDKSFKNTVLKIHIKVNSGMNRLGFNENEILELIEKIKKYRFFLIFQMQKIKLKQKSKLRNIKIF